MLKPPDIGVRKLSSASEDCLEEVTQQESQASGLEAWRDLSSPTRLQGRTLHLQLLLTARLASKNAHIWLSGEKSMASTCEARMERETALKPRCLYLDGNNHLQCAPYGCRNFETRYPCSEFLISRRDGDGDGDVCFPCAFAKFVKFVNARDDSELRREKNAILPILRRAHVKRLALDAPPARRNRPRPRPRPSPLSDLTATTKASVAARSAFAASALLLCICNSASQRARKHCSARCRPIPAVRRRSPHHLRLRLIA
jgi:hypothetical protein